MRAKHRPGAYRQGGWLERIAGEARALTARDVLVRDAEGRLDFAVTSVSIAEVLTGPFRSADEALARRYRTIFESWQVVPLDTDIAERSARLRATLHLRLPDAIQAASASAINAAALVTYDRDFTRVRSLQVIS